MREVSWTEFKKASFGEVVKRESVIVTGDGDFGFVAVIRPMSAMRGQGISLAGIIDASRDHDKW